MHKKKDRYSSYLEVPTLLATNRLWCRWTMRPEAVIYPYILAYIVRGKIKDAYFDLYNDYYKKGLLASQVKEDRLAKIFGKSKFTISRWIKEIEKVGLIKIDRLKHHTYYHNIYIVGTIKNGVEQLYRDDVFGPTALTREDALEELLGLSPVSFSETIPVSPSETIK